MIFRKMTVIFLVMALSLTGCADMSKNETSGAEIGAVLGAVIGAAVTKNRAQGAAIGALLGSAIGYSVGHYLDKKERDAMNRATVAALNGRTGRPVDWDTPPPSSQAVPTVEKPRPHSTKATAAAGASGWVVPVNDVYTSDDGRSCRDVQRVAQKEGKTYKDQVTVCRGNNQWVLPEV